MEQIRNPLKIISKHLSRDALRVKVRKFKPNSGVICAFNGSPLQEGVATKDLFSDTFTEYASLRYYDKSEYVSVDFALCLSNTLAHQDSDKFGVLRSYSFIATESELRILKYGEILSCLLDIRSMVGEQPYYFCVSYSGQKHLFYKAPLNLDREVVFVQTDQYPESICVDVAQVKQYLPILQSWYTILEGKEESTMQETYFIKKHLLFDELPEQKRIERYGFDRYMLERKQLEPLADSLCYRFVVYFLQKQYAKNKNIS